MVHIIQAPWYVAWNLHTGCTTNRECYKSGNWTRESWLKSLHFFISCLTKHWFQICTFLGEPFVSIISTYDLHIRCYSRSSRAHVRAFVHGCFGCWSGIQYTLYSLDLSAKGPDLIGVWLSDRKCDWVPVIEKPFKSYTKKIQEISIRNSVTFSIAKSNAYWIGALAFIGFCENRKTSPHSPQAFPFGRAPPAAPPPTLHMPSTLLLRS